MKVFTTILKILAALAAIAGVVYVIASYGDKIVAWAKNLLSRCGCKTCDCSCDDDCDGCSCQYDCDTECPCDPQPEEVQETNVVAEENDFEG